MSLKIKKIVCLIVGVLSILTIVTTVSYAYFSVVGNMQPVDSVITTATVSAKFSDYGDEVGGSINFGETIIKKFTIENMGTAEAHVKMYWLDLVNTYIEGSLTYTLSYSENENGPFNVIVENVAVPKSIRPSKKNLVNNLSIPVGKTYYYSLVISLNYLDDVNQDADLNAVFNSKFGVEDINEKLQVLFDGNGGDVDVSSKTLESSEKFGKLPVPTRAGYIFKGWYTEETGGVQVTEDMIVDTYDSFTLYARWTDKVKVTLHINFDSAGYVCYVPYFAGYDKDVREIVIEAKIGGTYSFLNDVEIAEYSTGHGCDGCYYQDGWFLDEKRIDANTVVTKMQDHDLYMGWRSSTVC